MKTVEEFVSKWSNWWITNNNKNVLNRAFENELKEIIEQAQKEAYNEALEDAVKWGYKEAMRWRDPINDPPKCNDLMQIKYGDIFSNIINYGHDRYLEDMGMWDIEQLANIKVLAWRPIK